MLYEHHNAFEAPAVTVESPNVIDAVGTHKETGDVILTISDHLPWGARVEAHRFALERKLGGYVEFIESGQIFDDYPKAKGTVVRIEAVLLHEPDESGLEVLETCRRALAGRSVRFAWRVPDSESPAIKGVSSP